MIDQSAWVVFWVNGAMIHGDMKGAWFVQNAPGKSQAAWRPEKET
ncbi:hypothetical protein [Desulfosediminicola sp.]